MRAVLRFLGTWIIGLGLIMLIIDGTKSLASKSITWTSLENIWTQLTPTTLEATFSFLESRYFAYLLQSGLSAVLSYPAFAVIGILGIVLALVGRRPRRERFLQPEYI
jgi:Na+/phosphate symporter